MAEPLNWPDDRDPELPALKEGWAALDQLLSHGTPRFDAAGLDSLADRVRQQTDRRKVLKFRRRVALVAMAAAVLIAVGIVAWPTAIDNGQPGTVEVVHIERPTAPTTESDEPAWDDDWTSEMATAQQTADDVEAHWSVPVETYADVRARLDELEVELASLSL
jgi:hypothetical protein